MATPSRRGLIVGGAAALVTAPAGATGMPTGSFETRIGVTLGSRTIDMPVHVHMPTAGADRPVLFVMHGVKRNAAEYRDQWSGLADARQVVVLVPEFSAGEFPGTEGYNFGGMFGADTRLLPRETWTFGIIDQVFRTYVEVSGSAAKDYDLYGHSAGAQFAHRFALFGGSTLARRIVSANAGAYAWPTVDRPHPYGLGGTGLSADDLARVLTREAWVLLGEADTDPKHPSLPDAPAAQAQGPHRLARGEAFHGALQTASTAAGVTLGWRLVTVPGVGHSNAGMAIAAARLLYG